MSRKSDIGRKPATWLTCLLALFVACSLAAQERQKPDPKPDDPVKPATPKTTTPAAPQEKATPEEKPVDKAAPQENTQTEKPTPASEPADPAVIRMFLMEGSVVTGKLGVSDITVETDFGTLKIPVTSIMSFTPGLDSHPEQRKSIVRLIMQLGANTVAQRDAAQKALIEMGASVRKELERYVTDEDNERRNRVQKIIAEYDEAGGDESEEDKLHVLIPQDSVTTPLFTVVGKISPQKFNVETQFGGLEVDLESIRRADRETTTKSEVRKTVTVTGQHFAGFNYLKTGIKVNRGDVINFTADGQIVMQPWGNQAISTPDGNVQWGWYQQNKIPTGAVCGRIGSSGEEFKIGAKSSITAKNAGELFVGYGMNPQFANQGYQFPGQYEVKIKVNSK